MTKPRLQVNASTLDGSWVQLVLVFATSLTVFILLRTNDYLAVDGALRALGVYHAGAVYVHENNHLLYPVNVYVWSTLLGAVGIHAADPLAFLRIAQAMNAVAAAGSVTIVYALSSALNTRRCIALVIAVGVGCSRAFLAHAINSAEPMVGLLWSGMSAVCVVYGLSHGKKWATVGGGVFLAFAMATYQSMVLIGLPLVLLMYFWEDDRCGWLALRGRFLPVLLFFAGFASSVLSIYGIAYYVSGTRSARAMIQRFVEVEASQVYGGASMVKLATVVPGFAYALLPILPRECGGFRCLYAEQYRSWIPAAGLAVAVTILWLAMAVIALGRVWPTMTRSRRGALGCCGLGLAVTLLPPLLWLPTYDKLWLQPVALWFLVTGVLVDAAWSRNGEGLRSGGVLACATFVMIAVIGVTNVNRAASSHGAPTPYLTEVEEIATLVGPHDLLVGDWNEMFILYQYLWAPRGNSFNVPTVAQRSGSRTATLIRSAASRTQASGGSVFFLGLLDLSEEEWAAVFGGNRAVPFDALEDSRRCATTIKSFPYHDHVVTLRRDEACK